MLYFASLTLLINMFKMFLSISVLRICYFVHDMPSHGPFCWVAGKGEAILWKDFFTFPFFFGHRELFSFSLDGIVTEESNLTGKTVFLYNVTTIIFKAITERERNNNKIVWKPKERPISKC